MVRVNKITLQRASWLLCVCLLAFGSSGGCQMDSASRIALYEQTLSAAQAKVADADAQIAALQAALAQARAAWDNPALPADRRADVQGTIDKTQAAIAKVQEYRQVAAAVALEAQAAVERAKAEPGIGAEVDILTQLVQSVSSRLGPEAAAWGTIATIVLSIVAAALKARQAKQAKTDLAALTATSKAIVRGVDNAATKNPDAGAAVKAEVLAEMQRKGIELEARQAVRDLKAT